MFTRASRHPTFFSDQLGPSGFITAVTSVPFRFHVSSNATIITPYETRDSSIHGPPGYVTAHALPVITPHNRYRKIQ